MIKIRTPVLNILDQKARLSAEYEIQDTKGVFWYELPEKYADWFVTDRLDGFVVGLLLQAMQLKEDILVEGSISTKLLHNLESFFIPMMVKAFPDYHHITITPASLTDKQMNGCFSAAGFSGGVDSFASVVQHVVEEDTPNYRISHLLFHNVGAHGHRAPSRAQKLFQKRYQEVYAYSEEAGIPLIPVDSNVVEVLPMDFERMYITLNASVPLVLQNQFERFYYASSYKYADCGVGRTDIIGRFDPFAFHLLSTESLDCISTGGQMSRVEKTAYITSYEPSYRYLNVCVDSNSEGKNCSVCIKCCRTILTLELLDAVHLYKPVFDLQRFKKIRRRYIRNHVMRSASGSFEYEIVEFARQACKERWAKVLRARQRRKDVINNVRRRFQESENEFIRFAKRQRAAFYRALERKK